MADEKTAPIIEDPKPEPTLIQQDGSIPETFVPVEPTPEPEPEPEPAPAEAPKTEEQPKATAKKPWFQTRIDELTKARREAERKAEEALARAKLLEAGQPKEGDTPLQQGLSRSDWDTQVRAEAQRLRDVERFNERSTNWIQAGVKEFGQAEFDNHCLLLAQMGGAENTNFQQLIVDPDIVPEGHKVVVRLAENPEEAQRILSLPPVQMAAALTKFAMTQPKPETPVSKAPAPIKPIGGSAKNATPSENDDIKVWMAKRRAEIAARQQKA